LLPGNAPLSWGGKRPSAVAKFNTNRASPVPGKDMQLREPGGHECRTLVPRAKVHVLEVCPEVKRTMACVEILKVNPKPQGRSTQMFVGAGLLGRGGYYKIQLTGQERGNKNNI